MLTIVLLSLLVFPLLNVQAAPPAGWNTLKDINILVGSRSSYEGWAGSGNGALEVTQYNQLPLDNTVTYNGNTSFRFNIQYAPDWWRAIAVTNLWWQTCNIERYMANGKLEFEVKGNAGGEVFYVGLEDRVKERTSGEFMEQIVLITDYVTVTTNWQHVAIPLSALITNLQWDPTQCYTFIVKNANQNPMKFWISNVKITSSDTEKDYPAIKVNQVGYITDADKYALVSFFEGRYSVGPGTTFYLKRTSDNATVYTGTLSLVTDYDQYVSGEKVLKADFSSYNTPGTYYISVAGIPENSLNFNIDSKENLYSTMLKDAIKYYYYQRANLELTSQYAGEYAHPAWHLDDANCPLKSNSSIRKNVSKGWYDAGDFGKYTNAAATAVSDLLFAYELFPRLFPDNHLNIPESGNGIPDLLDEIRYELDFLLGMQDSSTGGFYAYVWPQNKTDPRYIEDTTPDGGTNVKPTSCTANAAGVLAHAYIVFKDVDPTYANTLLNAARNAWTYLENNPNPIRTPTGPYDDGINDANDRFYAACCLFRAAGEAKYNDYVKAHYTEYASKFDNPENGHGCGNMEFIGFINYMKSPNRDAEVANWWQTKFTSWRNAIISRAQNCVWQNTLDGTQPETDYYWGSNGAALNSAELIVLGSNILGDYSTTHLKVIQNNLNYILGINPLRHSYVTGYGADCSQYPFSGIYDSDGKSGVPKGYMSGGANGYESAVFSRFHGKCYSNRFTEFASNEHTIYWNSLLVFNIAAVIKGLEYTIYADALATDWSDWSWGCNRNFNNTSPVKEGSKSIYIKYTSGWGGLSLRKGTELSTSGYNYIKFWGYSQQSDRQIAVYTESTDTGGASPKVVVTFKKNTWTEFVVPLSSLGSPAVIKRITFQNNSSSSGFVVYIDHIRLTN
ncbi:MAG: glycoside hydrolase family 9 protein [Bacillota bacterium]